MMSLQMGGRRAGDASVRWHREVMAPYTGFRVVRHMPDVVVDVQATPADFDGPAGRRDHVERNDLVVAMAAQVHQDMGAGLFGALERETHIVEVVDLEHQVIEAARVTNDILQSMGVKGYPKTSGSTGIHIYIPLGAKYTYEQSKEFARVIVKLVHQELPKFTSIERIVKARGGKMYLDFLQNRAQATVSAPYSLRPKPGATVSMPLHWDEVKKGLKMSDFTIYNALERIKSEGDIFKPVLGKGIDLKKIVGL